jgi:hypothetical protein
MARSERRPDDWQTRAYWQDDALLYHEVDDPTDNPKDGSPIPDWVLERRGGGQKPEGKFSSNLPIGEGRGVRGVTSKAKTTSNDINPRLAESSKRIIKSTDVPNDIKRHQESSSDLWIAVRELIFKSGGYFSTEELYRELGITSPEQKHYTRTLLYRLKESGEIESHPKLNRMYRRILKETTKLDILNASSSDILAIKWPLGVEDYVDLYPSNLAVVAGNPNAGKTGLLLNVACLNRDKFSVVYFSSEMEASELRRRLDKFNDMPIEEWVKVDFQKRASGFQDVVRPESLNIIDYMELADELYLVGAKLSAIQRKLTKGLAIVALQKKRGADLGRGAEFGLENPRLYLSMEKGAITIQKGKNWHQEGLNPDGLTTKFKLVNGCDFIPVGIWHHKEEEQK